jgi:hypothetical protein
MSFASATTDVIVDPVPTAEVILLADFSVVDKAAPSDTTVVIYP